ncbi:MAG: hypothetical protein LUB59_02115 [Candidatus Gastranaerophilales bacterium]|nr:hypothetical protein [Candidatus Gastranaerophilales bacterium]
MALDDIKFGNLTGSQHKPYTQSVDPGINFLRNNFGPIKFTQNSAGTRGVSDPIDDQTLVNKRKDEGGVEILS